MNSETLQILIIVLNCDILSFLKLTLVLSNQLGVDLELRSLGVLTEEDQVGLVGKTSGEPKERLLEVVVASSRQIVVLQVSLSVELDVASLDLSVLHINLVSDQDNWDVLADSDDISVPVGDVLVCDSAGHIEHDDGTLTLDVITVSQTSELLLASGVPHVEADLSAVSVELQGVDLDSQGGDVLLLELTSSVTLHESGLTYTTVTDKEQLELRNARHLSTFGTVLSTTERNNRVGANNLGMIAVDKKFRLARSEFLCTYSCIQTLTDFEFSYLVEIDIL
jgi:hypothetical protein